MSFTVIVNEQLLVLPAASLTPHVTVDVPFGNVEPDGGAQVGAATPGQLSDTVGAGYVTTAEHFPESVPVTTLAGQVIKGGCVSLIVTVNEQLAVLPEASLTVQVTVVVPFGNVEPDGGEQTGAPRPQLSLTLSAG